MTSRLFRPFCHRWAALFLMALAVLGGASSARAEYRLNNMWWTPEAVTKHGHEVDFLLNGIFVLTLIAFVLTQVVYVYFIVKYRRRKGVKAVYSHGNNTLEIIWTTIPAFIFIVLAVLSDKLWFQLRSAAPKDSLTLDIVAYQFGFHVRNPGVDGKLQNYAGLFDGKDQERMVKGENQFGVNQQELDPAGRDDYQSENLLTMPVNRPVNVILRSQDVIHAFYVPEFRMYQDIVPGSTITWVWFTPEKAGHYTLACNQLCGSGHYNMQAAIDVVSESDYEALVKKNSRAARKNWDKVHNPPGTPEAADTKETAEVAPAPPTIAVAKP